MGKGQDLLQSKFEDFLKGPNERMPQGFVQMTRSGTSQGLATWITTAELCVMILFFQTKLRLSIAQETEL